MIERLRRFVSGPPPDVSEAAGVLRLVYLLVFGGQLLFALLVGAVLVVLVPGRGAANDVVAVVLLVMASFHLPLGWVLGRAAVGAGGPQGALSGIIAAAVLLSIPAWFGVLLLVSGQRLPYVLVVAAIVSVGYALGFALTRTAAATAAANPPDATTVASDSAADPPASAAAPAPPPPRQEPTP